MRLDPSWKTHLSPFLFLSSAIPRGLYLLEKFSTRAVNATDGPVNLRLPYRPPGFPLSLLVPFPPLPSLSAAKRAERDKRSAVFHPVEERRAVDAPGSRIRMLSWSGVTFAANRNNRARTAAAARVQARELLTSPTIPILRICYYVRAHFLILNYPEVIRWLSL